MHPKLIEVFGLTLYTYGALHVLAYVLGLWLALVIGRGEGIDRERLRDLAFFTLFVSVAGSRIINGLVQTPSPSGLFSAQVLRNAGAFFYGLIPGVVFAYAYLRHFKLPILKTLDAFSPSVALGLAICRLGCFAAGCCYGKPTECWTGVVFTDPRAQAISQVPLNVRIHPTQLYESATAFLLFLFLLWVHRHRRFNGQVFVLMLLLSSLARFIVEIFRGDAGRGFVIGDWFSIPQLTAVVVMVFALALMLVLLQRARKRNRPEGSEAR